MATATIKAAISVKLVLTEEETVFLRDLLQNPLSARESEYDRAMRESIFTALAPSIPAPAGR
jgi:hypothetical protein